MQWVGGLGEGMHIFSLQPIDNDPSTNQKTS